MGLHRQSANFRTQTEIIVFYGACIHNNYLYLTLAQNFSLYELQIFIVKSINICLLAQQYFCTYMTMTMTMTMK